MAVLIPMSISEFFGGGVRGVLVILAEDADLRNLWGLRVCFDRWVDDRYGGPLALVY